MADLTISPLDCEAVGRAGVAVTAILTDADGVETAGHLTGGGVVARSVRAESDGATDIVLDLTPNVGRSVTDGVVVSGDTTVTSATAVFVAGDVGSRIVGTGIPDGATIASHNSATSVEISAAATANGTGVTLRIDTGAITPANTYYTVKVGPFSFLIEKTPEAQTLLEALAVDPVDLDLPILQQTVDTAVAAVEAGGEVTGPLGALEISAAGTRTDGLVLGLAGGALAWVAGGGGGGGDIDGGDASGTGSGSDIDGGDASGN